MNALPSWRPGAAAMLLLALLTLTPYTLAQSARLAAYVRADAVRAERAALAAGLASHDAASTTASAMRKPGGGGGNADATAPAPLETVRVYTTPVDPTDPGSPLLRAVSATMVTFVAEMTGDDGTAGTATAVEVRYRLESACAYDEGTRTATDLATGTPCFAAWTSLPGRSFSTVPPVGETVVMPTWDLADATAYLFAFRVLDEVPNRSEPSPVLRVTTESRVDFSAWSTSAYAVPQAGTNAALAFDAAGDAAVAFPATAGQNQQVRFTRLLGGAWTAPSTVDAARKLGTGVRLTLVGSRLGLAYGGNEVVRYREFDGGTWSGACTLENVRNASFALGSFVSGAAGAVLSYGAASGLTVARGAGTACASWTRAPFGPAPGARSHAVAVNPTDGTLGAAYTVTTPDPGGTRFTLHYAMSSDGGATWVPDAAPVATIVTGRLNVGSWGLQYDTVGEYLSLAYDAAGVAHVAHLAGPWYLETVRVQRRVGDGAWSVRNVDFGFPPTERGLAFDGGAAYVSYDREGGGAWVARSVGGQADWQREYAAWGDGSVVALGVGPEGPAVLFTDPQAGPGLWYALRGAGTGLRSDAGAVAARLLDGERLPSAFALAAAYPNPTASSATLRYGLPELAYVRVVVYDVLGREVAVLVGGRIEAGQHEAVLDAAGLPNGTYLVQMTTDEGFAQTRRLTVLR